MAVIMKKRNYSKAGHVGRLNCEVQTKWTSLQNKYRLRDGQTEPMIS
jgi:hypothetical protein